MRILGVIIAAGVVGGMAMGVQGEETVIDARGLAPVWGDFMGFGAEWDPPGYVLHGVTDEEFEAVEERVRWMRLPVARIMMMTKWCYFDGSRFVWDTPQMQALYRQLDICQDLGTTVFLSDWGAEREWTTAEGIEGVDDPEYAQAIGVYLDYLLNEKGYDCIKYFIMTNEPNLEVRDFDKWKRGLLNVAEVLKERGLDRQITLTGSDTSQDGTNESWHRMAVNQLHDVIGVYDIHRYAQRARVESGGLEDYWRAHWEYAWQNDPAEAPKPCIVGEAGMNDDADHPRGSPHINEYGYGVFMADYAVQAARAGSAAVAAWMLDDNSHHGFYWGLWSNKEKGMELRPWFYPWSLLARYVPAGSAIYAPDQPEDMRVLVARSGHGCTVVLVNRRDEAARVQVRLPSGSGRGFKTYVYQESGRPVTAEGFPVPAGEQTLPESSILSADVPSQGVAVLTSLSLD